MAQIFLNFVTGYEERGQRVTVVDLKKIRRNYLRGFFLIDLLSILPINYVEQIVRQGGSATGGKGDLKTLKILRLVRLTRLLRLARVKKLLKTYTEMMENMAGIFSLLSIIILALFLSHFVSCVWYYIGSIEGGWVENTFDCGDGSAGGDALAAPCEHSGKDLGARYLATYWWSLTLLLTAELSNNIIPFTNGEIIFVILLQLMGAIVFGFIIGTVGTILMSWGLLEEKITRKLAELREFMKEKNVPVLTRKKVKKYMEEYYRSKTSYDEREVVENLPPAMAVELLDSIYRGTLLKVPIFKDLDEVNFAIAGYILSPCESFDDRESWSLFIQDVICKICLYMKPIRVPKGEYVFKEKERGREMYIIQEGRVQIMRYGLTIGVLHKNCFFVSTKAHSLTGPVPSLSCVTSTTT